MFRPGRTRRLGLGLALALLAPLVPGGRAFALPPDRAITQLRHESWQTKDGLPQNSVDSMVQTRDGYLWLGTQEGLARFDGVRFTVFDRRGVPELGHNRILSLCEDRAGALWIGTEGGGLTRLFGGAFRTFRAAEGLPSDIVPALAAAPEGGVFAGTPGGVVRVADDGIRPVKALERTDAGALLVDARGVLWVGTHRSGLIAVGPGAPVPLGLADGLPGDTVLALAPASGGGVWVGGMLGWCRVDSGRVSGITAAPAPIRALTEDRDGALWIGTDGGGLLRAAAGRVEHLGTRDGFPDDTVGAVVEDREGNVWAGTQDGGLQRFSAGAFVPFGRPEGLGSDMIWALVGDDADGIWLGTKDVGAIHLDARGRSSSVGAAQGLSDTGVQALLRDPDGTLWLGTRHGGLNRWKDGRMTVYGTREGLASPSVSALLRDRSGTLWVGTRGAGLFRLVADGKRFERLDGPGAPGPAAVHALLEDRAGALWIGTNGGGLHRLKDGVFRVFTRADGLPIDIVNTLLEDERGVLWVGTYGGGLARGTDGRFAAVSTKQGLYDDAVFGLLEDGRGSFWISCNRGVFRIDRAAADAAAGGGAAPLAPRVYGTEDGMRSRECNGANSPPAWRGRDGRLWFPTGRGVVVVDPARLPHNPLPPPVAIQELLVDGTPTPERGTHVFHGGAQNLEIRYTATSLTEASRVRFKVKLEGYDRDWVDAGTRRAAYYTHLPPGDYVFRVKAANDDDVWNEKGASLALRFEPGFTETPWFWLVLTVAASGLAVLFVRDWLLRRAAREAELVALVAERTRQLEDANRELRLLSTTDALTGIANRRSFDDYLRLFWTQARRSGAAISVLMIDCDDFKGYNDAYGHLLGDTCLKKVAEALGGALSRTGDIVARFGGEEFAVLLLETPLEGCETVGERMRAAVEGLGIASAASAIGRVTVSVGGATAFPGAGFGPEVLIAKADELLYRAKRAGKNRVFIADEPIGSPGTREEPEAG